MFNLQGRSWEKWIAVRSVGGAGEVEGGARRGNQSRDGGYEKLPGADHSEPGLTSLIVWIVCLFGLLQ